MTRRFQRTSRREHPRGRRACAAKAPRERARAKPARALSGPPALASPAVHLRVPRASPLRTRRALLPTSRSRTLPPQVGRSPCGGKCHARATFVSPISLLLSARISRLQIVTLLAIDGSRLSLFAITYPPMLTQTSVATRTRSIVSGSCASRWAEKMCSSRVHASSGWA